MGFLPFCRHPPDDRLADLRMLPKGGIGKSEPASWGATFQITASALGGVGSAFIADILGV